MFVGGIARGLLVLLAACIGGVSGDSRDPTPGGELRFTEGVPRSSESWDGMFLYDVSAGYTSEGGVLSDRGTALANAYAWSAAEAMTAWPTAAFFDVDVDRCWRWNQAYVAPDYRDVGSSLPFRVAANDLVLLREGAGAAVEYWWEPMNVPEFAVEAGSDLDFAGVATGIRVPALLDLRDYDSTWREYLETGDLNLNWEDPAADSLVQISRYEEDGTCSLCTLVDDGSAEIRFGSPPGPGTETRYLFMMRVNRTDLDIEGIGHVFVESMSSSITTQR